MTTLKHRGDYTSFPDSAALKTYLEYTHRSLLEAYRHEQTSDNGIFVIPQGSTD